MVTIADFSNTLDVHRKLLRQVDEIKLMHEVTSKLDNASACIRYYNHTISRN